MKNVRSSGTASSLIMDYQLIHEVAGSESAFTCFKPNSAAFTNFFSTFVSLSNATLGFTYPTFVLIHSIHSGMPCPVLQESSNIFNFGFRDKESLLILSISTSR